MKLFRKNQKLIAYIILSIVVIAFIYLCYRNMNIIESFTCSSNTETNGVTSNQSADIEGDVCFNPSTTLSTKNNSKFQYISCVTEEEHPSIDDVKVNVVVRNSDGTFFNVVGESIVTHKSNTKDEESKEVMLINDSPMTPTQNKILPHNDFFCC